MKIQVSLSAGTRSGSRSVREAVEKAMGKKFEEETRRTKYGFTSLLRRVSANTPAEARALVAQIGTNLGSLVKPMPGRTKSETVFKLGDYVVSCKISTGKFSSVLVQYIAPLDR